jgi:archaetidylinositol phosphate synthase
MKSDLVPPAVIILCGLPDPFRPGTTHCPVKGFNMPHNPTPPPASHVREHRSVLAAVEKRALIWIAERLPERITSDQLSAIGLGSMVLAGLSLAAMRVTPWAAWGAAGLVVCLIANWFGDSLDGTVARVRGQQRPRFGYYVDHVIDLVGTTALLSGLAVSGLMSPLMAATVATVYLLVCAEAYLATHAAGIFKMSFLGFGPTELRILLAIGVVKAALAPEVRVPLFGPMLLFDVGGAGAIVGLTVAFVTSVVRTTRALYQAEPLPARTLSSRAA